jgi:preprotein translocase subunit SecF
MFVIRNKVFFFCLSLGLALASVVAVFVWGVRPAVDFTGGSIIEVRYASSTQPTTGELSALLSGAGFEVSNVSTTEHGLVVRTRTLAPGDRDILVAALAKDTAHTASIERLSSVGPSVGEELRRKTVIAIILVILVIVLYIAFVFRKVSKPVSSWTYGFVSIFTLLHDIVIPTGVFAVLGHFSGIEADTLFVVALLTILGLSVTDTVVVFDRIRENLRLNQERNVKNELFAETVGRSLEQTYVRSFNTSFTVILVLLVLFFLGGPTIHGFVLTLLIGMVVGTYSSIFIASPLLVVIAERKLKKLEAQKQRR